MRESPAAVPSRVWAANGKHMAGVTTGASESSRPSCLHRSPGPTVQQDQGPTGGSSAVLPQPCQEGIHTRAQGVATVGGEGEGVPDRHSPSTQKGQEAPTHQLLLYLQV